MDDQSDDVSQPRDCADRFAKSDGGRRIGFEAFYRKEAPRLVVFLAIQGADSSTAGDLVQDAMLEVYHRWEGIAYPEAYIRTVAVRAWGRLLGSPTYQRNVLTDDPIEQVSYIDQNTPLSTVLWNESTAEYLALVKRLPDRQRQVIACVLDGYSLQETAAILDITCEAVRASYYKARKALVRLWEDRT